MVATSTVRALWTREKSYLWEGQPAFKRLNSKKTFNRSGRDQSHNQEGEEGEMTHKMHYIGIAGWTPIREFKRYKRLMQTIMMAVRVVGQGANIIVSMKALMRKWPSDSHATKTYLFHMMTQWLTEAMMTLGKSLNNQELRQINHLTLANMKLERLPTTSGIFSHNLTPSAVS